MLIVGGRDEEAGVVSVRSRVDGDLGQMKLDEFVDLLRKVESEQA
jgi:threonyl-tRNA synthetase